VRRALLPLYGLILLETLVYVALIPLAPTFAEDLGLSKVETGALLAAGSFATIVVALPIGVLADRVGARALTTASAVLFTLSTLGQGLAGDFWSLLTARVAFGVAFGAVWTAGLAWLADGLHHSRATALGATVTVSGVAFAVGPAYAGLVGDALGPGAPFLVAAGAGALVTAALARRPPLAAGMSTTDTTLASLAAAGRDALVLASLAVMVVLGFVAGGVSLLVPLELRRNGLSAGEIGLALSAASVLFTLVSALVARLGSRVVTLGTAGSAALAYGLTFLLLLLSGSTAAALAFVLLRAPFWATLDTIVYPLGAAGARRASLGRGAVMGLLNLVWGVAATIGPLASGALAEAAGERWTFGLLAACCAVTGACMLSAHRALPAERKLEQRATTIETP